MAFTGVFNTTIPFIAGSGGVDESSVRMDGRTVIRGGFEGIDDESGVIGQTIEVADAAGQSIGVDAGKVCSQLRDVHRRGLAEISAGAEHVVNLDPESKHPFRPTGRLVGREDESQRFGEMRGDGGEDAFLATCLSDESHASLGEVPESAVEQPAGSTAGSRSDVVLFNE